MWSVHFVVESEIELNNNISDTNLDLPVLIINDCRNVWDLFK